MVRGPDPKDEAKPAKPEAGEGVRAPLPRWGLVVAALGHAWIYGWAGAQLPWSEGSLFSIVCYLLAAGHLATAVCAAARIGALVWVWRVVSVFGLAVFGWLTWELTSAASYLAGLYGSLGEGIGAGLLAIVGLVALTTVPLSLWGLAATWRRSYNVGLLAALPVLLVVWTFGAQRQAAAAEATPMPVPPEAVIADRSEFSQFSGFVGNALLETINVELGNWQSLPPVPSAGPLERGKHELRHRELRVPSLYTDEPVACVPDPAAGEAVAVLTFLAPDEDAPAEPTTEAPVAPVSRCVRAAPDELLSAIAAQLRAEALSAPVKIDIITAVAPLRSRQPLLDSFALRPGLDGVCDEQDCLMPWQLVALDQFILNEPLSFVPDFRYGISAVQLRVALGFDVPEEVIIWERQQRKPTFRERAIERDGAPTPKPPGADAWRLLDGLTRIETLSYVISADGVHHPLRRGRVPLFEPLTADAHAHALALAERHIAEAQLRSGRFRYTLHPYTGRRNTKSWNLPRQAGTTLAMCELGQDERRTRAVAKRSLDYMAQHAREVQDFRALILQPNSLDAHLGPSALPAIAFAACRARVGPVHDELIAGLARFLLTMQREDGSFYPKYDTGHELIVEGPEPMYAGGQAIFALSLVEKITLDDPAAAAAAGMPSTAELHEAVERAMAYYTGPYWDTFVRDFFWLEENWHCLAARASLDHHRNEAYEQYCLDYMAYKARLVFDEDSEVADEFIGSYSFGNILVPVNTPAAGFGEGFAAAIAIKQARGEDTRAERERMAEVLKFLVVQQWNESNCFACASNRPVIGGFSESMGAPEIRIDYTQHAWAALGHGGRWVFAPTEDER